MMGGDLPPWFRAHWVLDGRPGDEVTGRLLGHEAFIEGSRRLFERWRVRIVGALSWFYDRDDGELEYWPEGPDRPSVAVQGPFGNDALITGSDRMPHRVGPIGDPGGFAAELSPTSTMEAAVASVLAADLAARGIAADEPAVPGRPTGRRRTRR